MSDNEDSPARASPDSAREDAQLEQEDSYVRVKRARIISDDDDNMSDAVVVEAAPAAHAASPSLSPTASPAAHVSESPASPGLISAPRTSRLKRTREVEQAQQQPELIDDDEEEPEPSPEQDDDDDEEYGAPARRQPARATAAESRAQRASSRSRRRVAQSSSEESSESGSDSNSSEGDNGGADSDSDASEGKPKRKAPQRLKSVAAKSQVSKEVAGRHTGAGAAGKQEKTSEKAAAESSEKHHLSRFFHPAAHVPGSLSAENARIFQREREAAQAAAAAKKKNSRKRTISEDSDAEEVAEEVEEEAPTRRKPARSSRSSRGGQAAASTKAERSPPRGVRSSGRSRKVVSYKEDSPQLDEEEPSASPPAPSASRKAKSAAAAAAIAVDDDDEDDAAAPGDAGVIMPQSGEDDLFDEDDALRGAHEQFNASLGMRGKGSARARVLTSTSRKKAAAKKRRQKRRGSDEESELDSEEERAEERKFDAEKGLIYSDASESASSGDEQTEENPIDLLLGSRVVRIPRDPSNPAQDHITMTRIEYYVKYKSLAYMHADWVDKKTIELWKVHKGSRAHTRSGRLSRGPYHLLTCSRSLAVHTAVAADGEESPDDLPQASRPRRLHALRLQHRRRSPHLRCHPQERAD